jgi:hypothetical protein
MIFMKMSLIRLIRISSSDSSFTISEGRLRTSRNCLRTFSLKYLSSILIYILLSWFNFRTRFFNLIRLNRIERVPMRVRMGSGSSMVGRIYFITCLMKDCTSYSTVTGTSVVFDSSSIYLILFILNFKYLFILFSILSHY